MSGGGALPCPYCQAAGTVPVSEIDPDPDAEPGGGEPDEGARVECPVCLGDTVVPADAGFEALADGGEEGDVLDGGAAAALREMFEWIAGVEDVGGTAARGL
ncbi:MAG TPA: hypothetical protein VM490_16935 [Armatimonadaceae bacterium]|nr:hypothetical protein [Armatimonadaceae bacterium]